jgi:rod shape-determining protein MreC
VRGLERAAAAGHAAERALRAQEDFYRERIERQAAEIARLEGILERVSRTRRTLGTEPRLLPAQVILPGDASGWSRSFAVAAGGRDGVRRGAAVLWGDHLVGRVVEVGPRTARVALITDPEFRIGVLLQPPEGPADPQLVVAQGTGRDRLRIAWVPRGARAEAGDMVVTAGDPELGIPAGLLIGRVANVRDTGEAYLDIEATPTVRLERIADVAIVLAEGGS